MHLTLKGQNVLMPMQQLKQLESADFGYYLKILPDGNMAIFYNIGKIIATPKQIAASMIWKSPITTSNPKSLKYIMQGDGNFVIYDGNRPVFETGTWGKPGSFLMLRNDGKLVVVIPGQKKPGWISN